MNKAVSAIMYHEGKLRGVKLRKDGSIYHLSACCPDDASQLISSTSGSDSVEISIQSVIAGFDSPGIVFYTIAFPHVESEQLETLVQMQAEAILPLPANQMEWAWQTTNTQDHQLLVTLAAARTDQLDQCYRRLQAYRPRRIVLQDEAVAFGARRLFENVKHDDVIVYFDQNHTRVLQTHNGTLIRSAVVDLGRNQLAHDGRFDPQAAEQLTHELRGALDHLGCSGHNAAALTVLSDPSTAVSQTAEHLKQSGFNITTAALKQDKIVLSESITPESIFACLGEIGLAIMELEQEPARFDLFDRFYRSESKPAVSARLPSWPVALAAAAILLITLLMVMYHADTVRLEQLQHTLQADESTVQLDQLTEQNKIRQTIAALRPNMLELLSELDQAKTDSLLLDGLSFKRGKRISITGHCKKDKDLFKFQQALQNNKHFKTVQAENVSADKKDKQIHFTLTFDYRNISKK